MSGAGRLWWWLCDLKHLEALLSVSVARKVTIPHKELMKGYMDELTESARIIGAVNTALHLQRAEILKPF